MSSVSALPVKYHDAIIRRCGMNQHNSVGINVFDVDDDLRVLLPSLRPSESRTRFALCLHIISSTPTNIHIQDGMW